MRRIWLALAILALLTLSPALVGAQEQAAEPLPAPGTALEPGRYVSDAVGPAIGFRVGEGWLVGGTPDDAPIFTLERADPPGQVLTITRFDGDAFADSCDPTSLTQVEPDVRRLTEIIAGNPFLLAGPIRPIDVSGFSGSVLDVAAATAEDCSLPLILLWALPMEDGEFVQVPGQQSRFVALDVDGETIVIAIEAFPGVPFGGLLDASMELVESMRIEPGVSVPGEPGASPGPTPTEEAEPTPAVPGSPAPMPTAEIA